MTEIHYEQPQAPVEQNAGAINETKGEEVNIEKRVEEGENKALTNLEEVQNKDAKKGKGKKSPNTTSESCNCLIF